MPNTNLPHGISENIRSKCYRVYHEGKQYYISYKESTKEEALKDAIQFLACVRHYRVSLLDHRCGMYTTPTAANTTGVVGVRFEIKDGELKGYTANWQEGLPPNRRQRRKYFSFYKYGDKAFEEAVKFRKTKEKLLKHEGEFQLKG